VQESMRMLPVLADGTNRTTVRDTWLGRHLIPRGTMVWARAKRFLPFSAGTRDCVGQSLARMNYTTTVAMLLAHFKFQLTPEV
ncbi:cytochrome P450, partial [Coccomyxa subellipsoidea C-169]